MEVQSCGRITSLCESKVCLDLSCKTSSGMCWAKSIDFETYSISGKWGVISAEFLFRRSVYYFQAFNTTLNRYKTFTKSKISLDLFVLNRYNFKFGSQTGFTFLTSCTRYRYSISKKCLHFFSLHWSARTIQCYRLFLIFNQWTVSLLAFDRTYYSNHTYVYYQRYKIKIIYKNVWRPFVKTRKHH